MRTFFLGFCLLFLAINNTSFAEDLSAVFQDLYKAEAKLTPDEVSYLKTKEIILVPGILAETFMWDDWRSVIDLSVFTSNYFDPQKDFFKNLKIKVNRLKASSKSLGETKAEIQKVLNRLRSENKTAIFISHSLGGLALLEQLVEDDEEDWKQVSGIIFLQSPFRGSPIASVYLDHPSQIHIWLKPILPFLNVSTETIRDLSIETRERFMNQNSNRIQDLLNQVPVLTLSGTANGSKSIFKPAIDIIKFGCIMRTKKDCLTRTIYQGPYDDSDGMVPYNSSKLLSADFVRISSTDHAETIMKFPFTDFSKKRTTEALTKILLKKIRD